MCGRDHVDCFVLDKPAGSLRGELIDRHWGGVFTAPTSTPMAAVFLFPVGGMTIANQGLAVTVGTMKGDGHH